MKIKVIYPTVEELDMQEETAFMRKYFSEGTELLIVRLISQDGRKIKKMRENSGNCSQECKKYEQSSYNRKKTVKGLMYKGNFHPN